MKNIKIHLHLTDHPLLFKDILSNKSTYCIGYAVRTVLIFGMCLIVFGEICIESYVCEMFLLYISIHS